MASTGSGAPRTYAAFTALPGIALRLPDASLPSGAPSLSLPHRLATAGYGDDRMPSTAPEAFAMAQDVLEEHTQWVAQQAEEAAARAERKELMRVATAAASPAPAVGDGARHAGGVAADALVNGRAQSSDAQRAEAIQQVVGATGLSSENARRFLEECEWKVDQAVIRATASSVTSDEITLEFHLPSGQGVKTCTFCVSQSGFDVYAKAFDLIVDKERAFSMKLSGPKGSNAARGQQISDKLLDEGTWSFDLRSLGLHGGNTYRVDVAPLMHS